jgi:hypothetical protein
LGCRGGASVLHAQASMRKQLRKTDLMRRVETSQVFEVAGLSVSTPVEAKGPCVAKSLSRAR